MLTKLVKGNSTSQDCPGKAGLIKDGQYNTRQGRVPVVLG